MTYLNLHNDQPGTPRYTADDVRHSIISPGDKWLAHDGLTDPVVAAMDDAVRERVHAELAPCTPRAFLARYLELATEPLIIG